MSDEHDDLLREIGATMDVEPSAAFQARVRDAVQADVPGRARLAWLAVAAVLVTATAVGLQLGTRMLGRGDTGESRAAAVAQDSAGTERARAAAPPAPSLVAGATAASPTRTAPAAPPARVPARPPAASAAAEALASSRLDSPVPVIDPNQARLLRRLLATGVGTAGPRRTVSIDAPIAIAPLPERARIEIAAIRIEPLPVPASSLGL